MTPAPQVVAAPTVISELPPETLMLACKKPVLPLNTTADLVDAYVARGEALDICASKVDAIRAWRASRELVGNATN